VLMNNVWSVSGSGARPDVNQMPACINFINYNLKKGWYISVSRRSFSQLAGE